MGQFANSRAIRMRYKKWGFSPISNKNKKDYDVEGGCPELLRRFGAQALKRYAKEDPPSTALAVLRLGVAQCGIR